MSVNFGDVFDMIGQTANSDGAAIICDGQITTWKEFDSKSNALARALLGYGLQLQAKVGLYMRNGPEYLISFVACLKARLVPVNINFRYGPIEIDYLLSNSDAEVVIFDPEFRDNIPSATNAMPLIRISTGARILDELSLEEIFEVHDEPLRLTRSPDDIFLLYTGGTTGLPKGVMWPSSALWGALAASRAADPLKPPPMTVEALESQLRSEPQGICYSIPPPFMHGTGLFAALSVMSRAGTVVCSRAPSFDPVATLDAIVRHQCVGLVIVGDAFATPLVQALAAEPHRWDVTGITNIVSSGMMWSPEVKSAMLTHMPEAVLVDGLGATEAASIAVSVTTKNLRAQEAVFTPADTIVVDPETLLPLAPGSSTIGLIAKAGDLPLGYYKDPERTAKTYVVINGVRRLISGDHATVDQYGTIHFLGRGNLCINTAGEKVYPEEVEQALKSYPEVTDALVFGLADPKLGQRVVALVAAPEDVKASLLISHVKKMLAKYKAPKQVVVCPGVPRAPNGKADYVEATKIFKSVSLIEALAKTER